jgi:cobalamin biosynthesis protein CobT
VLLIARLQSIGDKEGEPEEGEQDEADDGGEDEGAADEQGEQPAGEQPEQEGEPGDGDAADEDEGGDEGEQPEDGDKSDEGGDGDAPEEASPDSPGEDGPSAQPEEGGDGDSEQQGSQPGDGDEGEDSSAPSGSEDEDGGEDSEDVKITVGDMLDGISGEPRNDAANAISVAVQEGIRNDTYLPFTTDYDQWTDVVVDPAAIPAVDREIMSADEKMRQMVGQMQAQMRRMFAQQATSVSIGGMRNGRLNASSLHRLFAGDDRVFARREEHEAMDTAVELLIDCSGSMSGDKIKVACHAAYVLSQTLERLGIVHAIDGFTTHGDAPDQLWYDIRDEMTKLGRDFSRIEPIRIYRFKKFEERLTHPVKQRLIGAGGTGGGRYGGGSFHSQLQMASNIDGESLLRVGRELLKRREPRKIMMVLSDGYPAGAGVNIDLRDHLKFAVRELERLKVETVGIGICDDAVKAFYPKNIVIHSVDDLPKAVMGELKRFLIDNKQVV